MNWFKTLISSPYSRNICPTCTNPIIIDMQQEKHVPNEDPVVGKCPYCKNPFQTRILNEEEIINFRWSILKPISNKLYRLYKRRNPELLVVKA